MLCWDFLLLLLFWNQHHTEPPVQIMSFGHVLFSLCWSRFGASVPQRLVPAPCRKSLRSCAIEVCLQFVIRGTLRVTAVSHKEWGQLVAKLSLIAKKLAAVDPACKSFKFGPKSCLTTVTGLKTVFSRNHSRYIDPLIPTPTVHVHFCLFFFCVPNVSKHCLFIILWWQTYQTGFGFYTAPQSDPSEIFPQKDQ